eukprot:GHVT01032086.1.p1 GENE.GHVT01032086.1~~GHVT01032086.1.p1  ORF type:complete len:335 (+),score=55.24 GHVT01032086.1:285-1289(+)
MAAVSQLIPKTVEDASANCAAVYSLDGSLDQEIKFEKAISDLSYTPADLYNLMQKLKLQNRFQPPYTGREFADEMMKKYFDIKRENPALKVDSDFESLSRSSNSVDLNQTGSSYMIQELLKLKEAVDARKIRDANKPDDQKPETQVTTTDQSPYPTKVTTPALAPKADSPATAKSIQKPSDGALDSNVVPVDALKPTEKSKSKVPFAIGAAALVAATGLIGVGATYAAYRVKKAKKQNKTKKKTNNGVDGTAIGKPKTEVRFSRESRASRFVSALSKPLNASAYQSDVSMMTNYAAEPTENVPQTNFLQSGAEATENAPLATKNAPLTNFAGRL